MTQIFLKLFNMSITAGWIVLAVKHATVIVVCVATANLVFYRQETKTIVNKVLQKVR